MAVNRVFLLRNVGSDPEIRESNGGKFATFRLATTDKGYTKRDGTQVPERTEWHNIVVWGKNAEIAERYIRKGSPLYIEGKLRTRVWEDRNQIKRTVTEIYAEVVELVGRRQESQP